MIGLIPVIRNDHLLTAVYGTIIAAAFATRYERKDWLFLVFGTGIMILSEAFFISTGVETFTRTSLLGIMPLWLPVLWGYAFVAIKRAILILDQ